MDWWIGEFVKTLTLVILALGLHRLIRGFGRSYTANIFDSTPQIGRVFLILADVAYYLIFAAYMSLSHKPDAVSDIVNKSHLVAITDSNLCVLRQLSSSL